MAAPSLADRRARTPWQLPPQPSHSVSSLSSFQYPLPSSSSASFASTARQPAGALAVPPSPRLPASSPSDQSLADFRRLCVEFYYDMNDSSGKAMEKMLKQVPSLQRKTYTTVQAAVRAQFHADTVNRKRHQLQQLLHDTQPGCLVGQYLGLSPASAIREWRCSAARKERYAQLCGFVRLYALKSHPGPHPFLKTLKALLLLQALALKQGGAGAMRIEWEIDDAVWQESGGEDFAQAGVELLKGVLGFEEMAREEANTLSRQTSIASTVSQAVSETVEVQPLQRTRPPVPPPRSAGSRPQLHSRVSDPFLDSPNSPLLSQDRPPLVSTTSSSQATPQVAHAKHYIRTFVAPAYLTNPELIQLHNALPHWLREPTRFSTRSADEESLAEAAVSGGHGLLRLSLRPRDAGYGGSFLERLSAWISNLMH